MRFGRNELRMSAREGVYLRLVRLIGVIVPRRLRADWKQEWLAELRYREELLGEWHKLNLIAKLDLTRRSLGAFWDAIWLQSYRLEDEMFQDLRYGARLLLKRPAFSSMVILILALGIGPTTAMFSVVNSVLLRPLPYTHPERLMVYTAVQEGGGPPINAVTAPDFVEWRNECSAAEIAAYTGAQPGNFTAGTEPHVFDIDGRHVSVAICYESVYPWIARAFAQRGSELLATVTNDAWFDRSSAAYQHFEQGAIRAVEEGRYVVRAANTGISGAVDPYGRSLAETRLFELTGIIADVRLLNGRTIYNRFGDVIAWLSLAVTAWAVWATRRPSRSGRMM